MIDLKHITKKYRTADIETTALDALDLRVARGEFVAIMGPSGCGKSTLLNVIGMLDKPDTGEYHFGDQEIASWSTAALAKLRKENVGFVFQNFNLIDELTVEENIALPLLYHDLPKAEAKQAVAQVMERLNITHRAKHYPQQLSGGQQQRVAVARAIVPSPKVILADEPTGNLDSKNGDEVLALLKELNTDGTTIIMVTHSEHDARTADRVVRLLDGKVQETQAVLS
ncbi:MAG: ABC transporter ATP-binding protein [Flavobacteriales bacterium]|nr:ABC transporter ATP-binding protein [Flavobacteriales bacterium]